MNQFKIYAKNYNVTLAQAIRDRDWPMTKNQCVQAYLEAAGKLPSETEIKEMRPDSQSTIQYQNELQDWENFDLGLR